jgi:hypothetical protein
MVVARTLVHIHVIQPNGSLTVAPRRPTGETFFDLHPSETPVSSWYALCHVGLLRSSSPLSHHRLRFARAGGGEIWQQHYSSDLKQAVPSPASNSMLRAVEVSGFAPLISYFPPPRLLPPGSLQ